MKKIAFIILSSIIMSSCTDMDLIPESNLSPENFFKSEEDATASVYSIYSVFTDNDIYNQFWEVLQSQGTDDSEWSGGRTTNNLDKNALDKFEFDGNTNLVYSLWIKHYVAINRSNFAIENIGIMNPDAIKDDVKNRLIGEAKFLRGMAYFNLVRIYGGVPLVLKQTTSLDGLEVPRNTVDECYDQIIRDLQEAKSALPAINQLPKGYLGRATKGSATALLAKVYLTRGDYQNVVKETAEVMQMGYKLWDNYADNFNLDKENGQESIFEIQYKRNTPGVSGSNYNGYYRPPFVNINGWVGYGDDPVTRNHYDCYEAGDLRRDVNTRLYTKKEYPNMSSNYEFPCYVNKFIDLSPLAIRSQGGENNFPVLRYSDVYLMRAEALNAINPSDIEAYNCLNIVRRRAFGLKMNEPSAIDIKAGLNKESFLDIILLERRKEFAFEGQRRFDLLRTHKLKEAMMAQNPVIGSIVDEKHYLLPIPVTEMDANKLLEQNSGW
ncbi:RagB/SusD family nutrient uptake outer membrane protein [Macellibacteroides fermentans]|uniref:RagB/SusD family nutrient uptake outer membrane protein n=1 Tax=Macellibacteroides fermentans TaxID=879969 RepID=UPI00406D2B4D